MTRVRNSSHLVSRRAPNATSQKLPARKPLKPPSNEQADVPSAMLPSVACSQFNHVNATPPATAPAIAPITVTTTIAQPRAARCLSRQLGPAPTWIGAWLRAASRLISVLSWREVWPPRSRNRVPKAFPATCASTANIASNRTIEAVGPSAFINASSTHKAPTPSINVRNANRGGGVVPDAELTEVITSRCIYFRISGSYP